MVILENNLSKPKLFYGYDIIGKPITFITRNVQDTFLLTVLIFVLFSDACHVTMSAHIAIVYGSIIPFWQIGHFIMQMSVENNYNIFIDLGLHKIIVNVSPISRYHSILCPTINNCLPQILTESSVRTALQIMYLSQDRSRRMQGKIMLYVNEKTIVLYFTCAKIIRLKLI